MKAIDFVNINKNEPKKKYFIVNLFIYFLKIYLRLKDKEMNQAKCMKKEQRKSVRLK